MVKLQGKIHFIGIGGIGMSGLAKILKLSGFDVSGSDISTKNKILDFLREIGCTIYSHHDHSNVNNASLVVRSSAVNNFNPEIIQANKMGIPIVHRSDILAALMKDKESIAITGMHGKTTTTSLIGWIFLYSGADPTIINGGIMKNLNSNARLGVSKFLIAEADESDKSLLNLFPSTEIITNLDLEHLDNYEDLDDIIKTFKKFVDKLPLNGKLIICLDDKNSKPLLEYARNKCITYGLDSNANFSCIIKEERESHSVFEVFFNNGYVKKSLGIVFLPLSGIHNIQNSLAAIATAMHYGIRFNDISNSLRNFLGVERRFDFKGYFKGAEVFDDYGHHPNEIEKVFNVAKFKAKRRLVIAFQPHRYSRTKKLWNEFIDVLSSCPADFLIITDIFPANEDPIEGVTSSVLVETLKNRNQNKNISYVSSEQELREILSNILGKDDLFLTLGAGKLDLFAYSLCLNDKN